MTDMQAAQTINAAGDTTNTQNDFLGVKLPSELMLKIRAAAIADGRSVSSFVRKHLGEFADQVISEHTSQDN